MRQPKSDCPHIALGARGEAAAAGFMSNRGYKILARNWRHGRLEIDLICERNGEIVFVEVKTRRSASFGGGLAAVNAQKQRKLLAAAQLWLIKNDLWGCPCRFDIICLYGAGNAFRMEHYANAFCQTLDSSYPYW